MAWANLTDVRCGYEVLGRGDPLLLVPGLGVTCNVWDPALPELAAHFSLILVDNRGIGRSRPRRRAESLRDYSADLVELMDHLQLERAHVLGLSLGGMIARRFAVDHPSRVNRLVLVSCTDRVTPYLEQVMRLLGGVLRGLGPKALAQVIETLGTSPEFFDANTALTEQRVREKTCVADAKTIAGQLACLAAEVRSVDARESVSAPTLAISGQYDPLIPSCYVRAMASRIPGSRFIQINGAGHNPLIECPDRVVPPIVDFLTTANTSTALGGRSQRPHPSRFIEEGAEHFAADG